MSETTNSNYLTAVFLGSTAFVFLNFGLPIRADDLGITAFGIGGMYAVFTGTMLLVRPVVGFCLDRFGRRWFFTFAFVFYTVSMFVMAYSTSIVDFYLALGIKTVALTLGPDGVLLATATERHRIPGYVFNAIDATGAGDTFDGCFLAELISGQSPVNAASYANAAAALSTCAFGAVPAIPSRADVERVVSQTA